MLCYDASILPALLWSQALQMGIRVAEVALWHVGLAHMLWPQKVQS